MGPIAVVCLMLLWPVLGWGAEQAFKPGERSGIYVGDGKESIEIEKLAIETAKMVGFESVVSSRPRPDNPHIKYVDSPFGVQLTAKCFPYDTEFPSVSCQVYAGKTGKILNMECRQDLQQCMVTDVLDIH